MEKIQNTQQTPSNMLLSSNIIQSSTYLERLLQMFRDQVRDIKFLFRASQHQFLIEKFFQICGNQTNVLIICKTTKGKIVGAYSPISHNFTGKQDGQIWKNGILVVERVRDSFKKSFIFSLTSNVKFKIFKTSLAVVRNRQRNLIRFGEVDLTIEDNGKFYTGLFTDNIFLSYQDIKSDKWRGKQHYKQFHGFESNEFDVQQWQAYKMTFKQGFDKY